MNSGIYQIRNMHTGRVYIGSSKNILKRFREHLGALRRGVHINPYLQHSFNRHTEAAFEFKVLEYTTNLFEREVYHLRQTSKTYNLGSIGGGDNLSNHPNREDIIKRITESCKDAYARADDSYKETNKTRNTGQLNPNYGKRHSEETRKEMSKKRKQFFENNSEARNKLSESMSRYWNSMDIDSYTELCRSRSDRMTKDNHFKGANHSEETKQALSELFKSRYAAMSSEERFVLNPQTRLVEIEGITYYGVSEAGRQLGVVPATIVYRIKSKSKKWDGYRYLD